MEDFTVEKVVVGEIETNCYIVSCMKTGIAVVIDPGDEYEKIAGLLDGRKVAAVLNTHGHIDHIKEDERFGVSVYIHLKDSECLTDPAKNLSSLLGFSLNLDVEVVRIEDGDVLRFGNLAFEVLHTPGHSPGSSVFRAGDVLFSGDTMFCGDYGRTDLPGGSEEELFLSVREKILVLPGETVVYPGHGPRTTIGKEKKFWDTFL